MADIKNLKVASQMDAFKKDLIDYQGLMNQLANLGSAAIRTAGPGRPAAGPGKALVDLSVQLVASSASGFWKSSPP